MVRVFVPVTVVKFSRDAVSRGVGNGCLISISFTMPGGVGEYHPIAHNFLLGVDFLGFFPKRVQRFLTPAKFLL